MVFRCVGRRPIELATSVGEVRYHRIRGMDNWYRMPKRLCYFEHSTSYRRSAVVLWIRLDHAALVGPVESTDHGVKGIYQRQSSCVVHALCTVETTEVRGDTSRLARPLCFVSFCFVSFCFVSFCFLLFRSVLFCSVASDNVMRWGDDAAVIFFRYVF